MRVHTREKPYQCSHCERKFSQHGQLVIHIRTHTGEKPYACTQCNKAFTCSKVLKIHSRTHTGERPFECQYCKKKFAAYANLVVHRRIHTKERPYSCKLCTRAFEHSGNLTRHAKGHQVENGVKCILCGQVFQEESDLIAHSVRDHASDFEKEDAEEMAVSRDSEEVVLQIDEGVGLRDGVGLEDNTININNSERSNHRNFSTIDASAIGLSVLGNDASSQKSLPVESIEAEEEHNGVGSGSKESNKLAKKSAEISCSRDWSKIKIQFGRSSDDSSDTSESNSTDTGRKIRTMNSTIKYKRNSYKRLKGQTNNVSNIHRARDVTLPVTLTTQLGNMEQTAQLASNFETRIVSSPNLSSRVTSLSISHSKSDTPILEEALDSVSYNPLDLSSKFTSIIHEGESAELEKSHSTATSSSSNDNNYSYNSEGHENNMPQSSILPKKKLINQLNSTNTKKTICGPPGLIPLHDHSGVYSSNLSAPEEIVIEDNDDDEEQITGIIRQSLNCTNEQDNSSKLPDAQKKEDKCSVKSQWDQSALETDAFKNIHTAKNDVKKIGSNSKGDNSNCTNELYHKIPHSSIIKETNTPAHRDKQRVILDCSRNSRRLHVLNSEQLPSNSAIIEPSQPESPYHSQHLGPPRVGMRADLYPPQYDPPNYVEGERFAASSGENHQPISVNNLTANIRRSVLSMMSKTTADKSDFKSKAESAMHFLIGEDKIRALGFPEKNIEQVGVFDYTDEHTYSFIMNANCSTYKVV